MLSFADFKMLKIIVGTIVTGIAVTLPTGCHSPSLRMTKCIKCGKEHGMVVEEMRTGTQSPIKYCKDCLFSGCVYKVDSQYYAKLEENMKELNRILKEATAQAPPDK